jgi:peptide/nickel transport system permease protein
VKVRNANTGPGEEEKFLARPSAFHRFLHHRMAAVGAALVGLLLGAACLADVMGAALGVSATDVDLDHALLTPLSGAHLLGTDELGRDVFLRLLYGGRISLSVGVICAISSAFLGTTIGLCAGYYGGWVDAVLMRLTDTMLSIPVLPLLMILSAVDLARVFDPSQSSLLGAVVFSGGVSITALSLWFATRWHESPRPSVLSAGLLFMGITVMCLLGWWLLHWGVDWKTVQSGTWGSVVQLCMLVAMFGWMTVARLARAATLQIRSLDYVTAARVLGASDLRILRVHILPGVLSSVLVASTLEVGSNILYEAALSFMGLGVKPPVPSWGNMLTHAQEAVYRAPLMALWPGLCVFITVMAFNFLGDGLRDALNPKRAGGRNTPVHP